MDKALAMGLMIQSSHRIDNVIGGSKALAAAGLLKPATAKVLGDLSVEVSYKKDKKSRKCGQCMYIMDAICPPDHEDVEKKEYCPRGREDKLHYST